MTEARREIRLGITDNLGPGKSFEDFVHWMRQINPGMAWVKLSYHLKNEEVMESVDGLLLSGGGDVHPALYGMSEATALTEEVNELRDAFEFKVIEKALEREIPILGVCRGMQIMNVYLGGTLIVDLPAAGFKGHTSNNGQDLRHSIVADPHSMLASITGPGPHEVNSIHHQAVDQPGRGLKVAAKSEDGVIEAMEWVLKDRMPFLLLLQWHPERMADFDNPCVRHVAEYFLNEVTRSHNDQSIDEKETEQ